NWTGKIFTADFREVLRPQMDWKRQLTFATLLRYPGGPGSGSADGPGAYLFETQLQTAIDLAPTELAPRVLMLAHCHEAQLRTPAACTREHAEALIAIHPENALGYLYLGALAVQNDDHQGALDWFTQAARQPRIQWGWWSIVSVFYGIFGEVSELEDDPLKQQDVARLLLAFGVLAHFSSAPHDRVNLPCQRARSEPLLSACLAAANAFRLPGTEVRPVQLALAFEDNAYRQRGDEKRLAQLELEQRAAQAQHKHFREVWDAISASGQVQPYLDTWVEQGELDTTLDRMATALQREEAEGSGVVLASTHNARVGCLDEAFPPGAPDCVTRNMVAAETARLTEVLDGIIAGAEFRDRLKGDTSDEAQILRLLLARGDGMKRQPPLATLSGQFPAHPLANRIAAEWCQRDALCLLDVGQRIIKHEPEDAVGYLIAAAAQLELGEAPDARRLMQEAARAPRLRSGFALVLGAFDEVLGRHATGAPVDDPLGVWPMTRSIVGVGYAAALALPGVGLFKHCQRAETEELRVACLAACTAMELPGTSLVETVVGQQTAIVLLEQLGREEDVQTAISRLAETQILRDHMVSAPLGLMESPSFHEAYLKLVLRQGEMAAVRELYGRQSQARDAP
ncbi:MAG: hypothetical protein AAGA23_21790, partial [Pseudomonadota bacterium]